MSSQHKRRPSSGGVKYSTTPKQKSKTPPQNAKTPPQKNIPEPPLVENIEGKGTSAPAFPSPAKGGNGGAGHPSTPPGPPLRSFTPNGSKRVELAPTNPQTAGNPIDSNSIPRGTPVRNARPNTPESRTGQQYPGKSTSGLSTPRIQLGNKKTPNRRETMFDPDISNIEDIELPEAQQERGERRGGGGRGRGEMEMEMESQEFDDPEIIFSQGKGKEEMSHSESAALENQEKNRMLLRKFDITVRRLADKLPNGGADNEENMEGVRLMLAAQMNEYKKIHKENDLEFNFEESLEEIAAEESKLIEENPSGFIHNAHEHSKSFSDEQLEEILNEPTFYELNQAETDPERTASNLSVPDPDEADLTMAELDERRRQARGRGRANSGAGESSSSGGAGGGEEPPGEGEGPGEEEEEEVPYPRSEKKIREMEMQKGELANSKMMAKRRKMLDIARGTELHPQGTKTERRLTGQVAGDEENEDFFARKTAPSFGQNGELMGDPNRKNPITPATGAASQRAGFPNAVKKTVQFKDSVMKDINRYGAQSVFGDARSRTNAVGAGGSVNDWSFNGPFDYPDRKVDASLSLLGAWRNKVGGANTLWTSMLNSRGQLGNKNRYFKYSGRKGKWSPIKNNEAIDMYLKKKDRQGSEIYGVPTGTRFSNLVKLLRRQKERDNRLAQRGGELMERRKRATVAMEKRGLHTQK